MDFWAGRPTLLWYKVRIICLTKNCSSFADYISVEQNASKVEEEAHAKAKAQEAKDEGKV